MDGRSVKTTTRPKLTADEIRAGLWALGLTEEEKPIDGYGFLFTARPGAAVTSYQAQHGAQPTRFYIDRRTYILSA